MIDIQKQIVHVEAKVGETVFVAVDGRAGSGKSTLAEWLANKLSSEVIHTDDFANWNNPLNWSSQMIETIFMPIQNGATTLSYQPTSWWETHHPQAIKNQPVTSIIILEGIGAGRIEFDSFISYRIFVDTPKNICLERGLTRDMTVTENQTKLHDLWSNWQAKEDHYLKTHNPKMKADLVINGTVPLTEQIC